jgi:hypothetical protein
MDLARYSKRLGLRTAAVALTLVTALAGCSGSSRELRTPGQAAGFVAAVALGEPPDGWHLASHASRQAAQAWAARSAIADLGRRLRGEEAPWTCEAAHKLVALGTVGGITSFNANDVGITTGEALQVGAKPDRIAALMHDARTIPFRDLALLAVATCGPPTT